MKEIFALLQLRWVKNGIQYLLCQMIFFSIQNFATNLLHFVFWIQEAKEAWSAYDQHYEAGWSIDAPRPDRGNAIFFL